MFGETLEVFWVFIKVKYDVIKALEMFKNFVSEHMMFQSHQICSRIFLSEKYKVPRVVEQSLKEGENA